MLQLKNIFETFLKILFIFKNPKLYTPKFHPSNINLDSILVNPNDINNYLPL